LVALQIIKNIFVQLGYGQNNVHEWTSGHEC
jgi:hypothetical protein